MSYSFEFRAATKAEAMEKAVKAWADIVAAQPVHVQDQGPALAALTVYLFNLMDAPSKDIQVNCHGSVSYDWRTDFDAATVGLNHASLGISVHHVPKKPLE